MSPSRIVFLTADDATLRRATDLLSQRDLEVVHGGRAGLLPDQPPPALVLLDTVLDGTDAATELVRLRKGQGVRSPVLIVADRASAEAAVAASRAGAEDVLFKPLDPLGFPARVEGLLARQALAAAREHGQTLEFRNQELESFIYIVTHDMKTPVLNLQGLVGLVEQEHGPALPAAARDYLARLRRNADRLEELLRDLLEYPRKLRIVGPVAPADSGAIAAAALDGLVDLARAGGVDVRLQADLPTISCDAKRLQQVFHNLAENAIKHSQGRPTPLVEVGWTPSPRGPLFHVKDNGPGIPKEHLKEVFRLFHRIPGNAADGTGIGLAVARQLVEAHGGEIWCESTVGEGSTFLFTLGR